MMFSSANNTNNNEENQRDHQNHQPAEDDEEEDFAIWAEVKRFLVSSGLSYSMNPPVDDGNAVVLSLMLSGENCSYKTYIDLKKREERMSVYVETPVKIPEHKRSDVCEYLMRVNYSLALGNFEVDFRDGEVRYRLAIDIEGTRLSQEMIRTNVMVSAATADRFFPGLMAVTFAHKEPAAAVDDCRAAATTTNESSSMSMAETQ